MRSRWATTRWTGLANFGLQSRCGNYRGPCAPREVHLVGVEALAAAAHVRRRIDRPYRARKGHQAPALVLPHLLPCPARMQRQQSC